MRYVWLTGLQDARARLDVPFREVLMEASNVTLPVPQIPMGAEQERLFGIPLHLSWKSSNDIVGQSSNRLVAKLQGAAAH